MDQITNEFVDLVETVKYQKRSDIIVQSIKQWIVNTQKKPGDRLPKEKELMSLYKASKGVIRETLKSMEIQGLITVSTGPRGGATIREVPEDTAMGLLANYFFFKDFELKEIYEVSKTLEPLLAANAVGRLSPEHFKMLDEIIRSCEHPARDIEEGTEQLMAEVRFHEILAEVCPNIFLSFFSRFMKNLIRDLIVIGRDEIDLSRQREFTKANLDYHKKIVDSLRQNDANSVSSLMKRHVDEVEEFVLSLESKVVKKFLYL